MKNIKYIVIALLVTITTLFRGCADQKITDVLPEEVVSFPSQDTADLLENDLDSKAEEENLPAKAEYVFVDFQKLLTLYAQKDIVVKSGYEENSRKVGVIEKGMKVLIKACSEDGKLYQLEGGGYIKNDDSLCDKPLGSEEKEAEEEKSEEKTADSGENDKKRDQSTKDQQKTEGSSSENKDDSQAAPSVQTSEESNQPSEEPAAEQPIAEETPQVSEAPADTGISNDPAPGGISINYDPNLLPGGGNSQEAEPQQPQAEEHTYNIYLNTDLLSSVNSVRSSNGVPEYSWRGDKEEDAKTRAREIVDNFSHSSPSGISAYSECITWTGAADSGTILGSYSSSPIHYGTITQSATLTGFVSANCDEYINGVYVKTYNVILMYD